VKTVSTIAVAIAVAALSGPGAAFADVQDIVAIGDATIFSENIAGANGQGHLFVGSTNEGHARRALVIFDVSTIPPGSIINSVNFRLQCTKAKIGAHSVSLHRMTKSWTEGTSTSGTGTGGGKPSAMTFLDVTWKYASFTAMATDTFLTPGGDYDPGASATLTVGGLGQYNWSGAGLESDVSGWVNASSTNYGWILIGDEVSTVTTRRFDSREDTLRPVISVEFTPPTPVEATSWGRVKSLYRLK